jgi:lysozyme family protein
MSNPSIYREFTKAREGGLSNALTDSASAFPCPERPDGTKGGTYHTNMGITWKAFTEILPKYGIKPTPKLFYEMSDITFDIIYNYYWQQSGAGAVNSQAIANLVFQAMWGGGLKFLVRDIQLFLRERGYKISADGDLGPNTAKSINEYTKQNEKMLHEAVFNARLAYLRSLKAYKANGKGWEARMQKLYKFNQSLIK